MATPKNIEWTGPSTYVDGRPYGEADHGGYELELNGSPAVAIPTAWNVSNQYTFPVASLDALVQGTNTIRMRTVAANGEVSEYTAPVTFAYASVPLPPTGLAVR